MCSEESLDVLCAVRCVVCVVCMGVWGVGVESGGNGFGVRVREFGVRGFGFDKNLRTAALLHACSCWKL